MSWISLLFIDTMTEERAQELIDEAMKSGSLQQRNVVGVITGLMGAGKTTLLYHLFGLPPPDYYSSSGVAEESFRGLLHNIILHASCEAWRRMSYKNIQKLLARLIKAGMRKENVDFLASKIYDSLYPDVMPPPELPHNALSQSTQVEHSHTSKEVALLVQTDLVVDDSPDDSVLLELVHMIDTGGQPELMEVMPCLLHNSNLAMVLINLELGLDKFSPITYHEAGECYERPLSSQFTGRDVVLKLASTLHAKKSVQENFRLLIIATHSDCVSGLKREVDALNNELCNLLLPEFKDELIVFESCHKIAFVLNLKTPKEDDRKALTMIRDNISKSDLGLKFDTPISFFALEQDLLQFAETDAQRDILSLSECILIGARLNMSSEMVRAALILFHRQNTFLYFHRKLPNHIFVKPQVPLDILNCIVRLIYKKLKNVPAKYSSLLDNGIITEEILISTSQENLSRHFKEGFYEPQHAIELFCHTFTLAPLQPDSVKRGKREYLMMCLKPAVPVDQLNRHLHLFPDVVPLVFLFSSGCVPLGCYGSTISCLLSHYGWEVIKLPDGSPKCLAHNIASLHHPKILVNVTLVDYTKHLEIHVDSDLSIRDSPARICGLLRNEIEHAILNVFDRMLIKLEKIQVSLAVFCSCSAMSSQHFAKCVSKNLLCCDFSKQTLRPNKQQSLWVANHTETSLAEANLMSPSSISSTHGTTDDKSKVSHNYSSMLNHPFPHGNPQMVFPSHSGHPSSSLPQLHSSILDPRDLPKLTTRDQTELLKPKLSDLIRELRPLAWDDVREMFLQLDVPYNTIRDIELQYRDPSSRISEAAHSWLSSNCQASWKKVIKALRAINRNVVAKKIEDDWIK